MAGKKTVLTFDQAGGMKADATGFVGKACEETTAKLLAGLGADKVAEEKKAEYNRTGGSTVQEAANRW